MTIEIPTWFLPSVVTVLLAGAGGIIKAVAWVVRREFARFEETQKTIREEVAGLRADVRDHGRRLTDVEIRLGVVLPAAEVRR